MSEHIREGTQYGSASEALQALSGARCNECEEIFWRNLYNMRWWRDFLYPRTGREIESRYSD